MERKNTTPHMTVARRLGIDVRQAENYKNESERKVDAMGFEAMTAYDETNQLPPMRTEVSPATARAHDDFRFVVTSRVRANLAKAIEKVRDSGVSNSSAPAPALQQLLAGSHAADPGSTTTTTPTSCTSKTCGQAGAGAAAAAGVCFRGDTRLMWLCEHRDHILYATLAVLCVLVLIKLRRF